MKRTELQAQRYTGRNNILLNADAPLTENIIEQLGENRLSWDLLTKLSQTIKQTHKYANTYDD